MRLILAALATLSLLGATAAPEGARPVAQEGEIGTALIGGRATWYCSETSPCTAGYDPEDMVAAIDPTLGIPKGATVTVCHDDCIVVRIVDVCACAGSRLIDLTSGAFARLAPLDRGVIDVTIEVGGPDLPETDTEGNP